MTSRLSSNQFTIIRTIHAHPLPFETAVVFNQVMFYSLVRRDLIQLELTSETFRLTEDGLSAYETYAHTPADHLTVSHNTDVRRSRVTTVLMKSGKRQQRRKSVA